MANTRGNLFWCTYLSDDGTLYRAQLTDSIAEAGGFAKLPDDSRVLKDYPIWPVANERMRNVRLVYFTEGGKRVNRFLPCASPTNPHYTFRSLDVTLDGKSFKVNAAYGEIRPGNWFSLKGIGLG